MHKEFTHEDFNIERLRSQILPNLPHEGRNRVFPVNTLLSHLASIGCKAVIWEKDYVDKDYLNEFASFYSTRFKRYESRCQRLHFFNVSIASDLEAVRYSDRLDSGNYLGYAVLRPTESNRLGRTVIRPLDKPGTHFVTCAAEFSAHILGQTFSVVGTPFFQQDTQVSSCAQSAIWMAVRYLSQRFGLRDYLPAEISLITHARSPFGSTIPAAEQGLSSAQILDALHRMGLSATLYHKKHLELFESRLIDVPGDSDSAMESLVPDRSVDNRRTFQLADIAHKYIESRLPVILATKDHALVAVGHTLTDINPGPGHAIRRIPSFLIHDDGRGPYLEIPMIPSHSKPGDAAYTSFDDIESIIVVTPSSATLSGMDAEAAAICAIEELPLVTKLSKPAAAELQSYLISNKCRFEYRTYLISSLEFQEKLRIEINANQIDQEVAYAFLRLDLPKYLWVTEVAIPEELEKGDLKQRKCRGRIIIDGTAPKKSHCVLAIHAFGTLTFFDRNDPENTKTSETEKALLPQHQTSFRSISRASL